MRPADWPRDRSEQYALRDRSELARSEFYASVARGLGDDGGRVEIDGRPSA